MIEMAARRPSSNTAGTVNFSLPRPLPRRGSARRAPPSSCWRSPHEPGSFLGEKHRREEGRQRKPDHARSVVRRDNILQPVPRSGYASWMSRSARLLTAALFLWVGLPVQAQQVPAATADPLQPSLPDSAPAQPPAPEPAPSPASAKAPPGRPSARAISGISRCSLPQPTGPSWSSARRHGKPWPRRVAKATGCMSRPPPVRRPNSRSKKFFRELIGSGKKAWIQGRACIADPDGRPFRLLACPDLRAGCLAQDLECE